MRRGLWIATLSLALPLSMPAWAEEEVQVSVRLTPSSISVDRMAELTIQLRAAGLRLPEPDSVFELHNLRIVHGPSRGEQLQFGSSGIHRRLTLTWRLAPLAPGAAEVKNIKVSLNGRTLRLPDQVVSVATPPGHPRAAAPDGAGTGRALGAPDAGRSGGGQDASGKAPLPGLFLRAEVEPSDPYVGQRLVWRLLLYADREVTGASPQELPSFDGFWVEEISLPDPRPTRPVQLQGQSYGRMVLLERALYPLEPGRHELSAAQFGLRIESPLTRILGPLVSSSRNVRLTSNVVVVRARPLPPAPAGFRGLVGSVQLHGEVAPRELRAGEAATLTVTLTGGGPVGSIEPPALPRLEGVRIFPARSGGADAEGARTWRWLLIPEQAGSWHLPAVRMPYFEPRSAEYRTAATTSFELLARPAAAPDPAPEREVATPAEESSDWWVPAVATALALGLLVPLWRRRRRRPSAPETLAFLEAVRRTADVARPRQVAREIEAAWRQLLSRRGEIAAELPRRQWLCQLGSAGWEQAELERLGSILQDLEYLRHAPELASAEEIRKDVVRRSQELIAGMGQRSVHGRSP